jgi:uncharacterized membrane protein YfcA
VLVLAGFVSGIISGMGIGGGAILIPALVFLGGVTQHAAQCTNLIYFIPTALVALGVHIKNKRVDIRSALPIILFGLIGAYAGSRLAISLNGKILGKLFGVFLLAVGIYELFRKRKTENAKHKT